MRWTAAAVVIATLACISPTRLTHVQVAPEAERAKVKNVLVVGLFNDPAARKMYEYNMVKSLKEAGAQAQASEDLMPIGKVPTRPDLEKLIQEKKFDGAVVGRLVDARTDVRSSGTIAVDPGFYDWYGEAAPAYNSVLETTTTVVVETRVFRTATGEAQFSATSQTIDPHSLSEVAQHHAPLVVGALRDAGLM